MDSPFKTPSKLPMSQMLPSSGSSSPFTPKRSKIKKISSEGSNSVSRILAFDESNSRSPSRMKLDFLSFSQQPFLNCENKLIQCEQTTPVKIERPNFEKNKILLSPSIKNHPKRFNISEQDKNTFISSPSKRNGSNNSTPSKKLKQANVIANCKPITDYFKPIQKRPDSIMNNVGNHFLSDIQKSNEENMNPTVENCIKSEFDIIDTESFKPIIERQVTPNKNDNINNIQVQSPKITCVSSSLPNKQKNSPLTKTVKSPRSNKKTVKELNVMGPVTPNKSPNIFNNTPLTSPRIIEYLDNKVNISGGDTYSRFIKFIVLRPEIFFFGKKNIMKTIEGTSDNELKIYGRLISRKHEWIRLDGLQRYRELNLCDDFDSVLKSLATKQLINTGNYTANNFFSIYFCILP